jgi:hypothetical protein
MRAAIVARSASMSVSTSFMSAKRERRGVPPPGSQSVIDERCGGRNAGFAGKL